MSNTVKVDDRAFARGVDEVLTLKPLRRVVWGMLNSEPVSENFTSRSGPSVRSRTVVTSKVKPKRDNPTK